MHFTDFDLFCSNKNGINTVTNKRQSKWRKSFNDKVLQSNFDIAFTKAKTFSDAG